MSGPPAGADVPLPAGTVVEVYSPLTSAWVRGFRILGLAHSGYRLQRASDCSTLPATVEVRRVRRESSS